MRDAGLVKCGECGKVLTIRKTNAKNLKDVYACVTYNRFGKQHCTQHRVDYDTLYQMVLDRIMFLAKAQSEQEALEKQIAETQKVLDDTAIRESDARQWAEHIKEYANIRELDRETLNRLVRAIIVHEEIADEKNRTITIEIQFNFKSLPEISGADDPVGTTGKTGTKKRQKAASNRKLNIFPTN